MELQEINYDFYHKAVELQGEEALEFFDEFFSDKNNIREYVTQFPKLTVAERYALTYLNKHESLYVKAKKALECDPCCFEAVMILSKYYSDDEELYIFFEECFNAMCKIETLSEHGKENFILFAHIYADWLLKYGNIELSLKVQEKMIELDKKLNSVIAYRYIYCLAELKQIDKLYSVFENNRDVFRHFMLCLQLLDILISNNREFEALEVLDVYNEVLAGLSEERYIKSMEVLDRIPSIKNWIKLNTSKRINLS